MGALSEERPEAEPRREEARPASVVSAVSRKTPDRGERKKVEISAQHTEACEKGPKAPSPAAAGEAAAREAAAASSGRRRSTFKNIPTSRMSREAILQHLAVIPHVKALTEQDRRHLADICTLKQFEPHAEVVKYGERSNEIIVVLDGSCSVSVPQFVRTLTPGDFFGEGALLKGEISSEASLTAPHDKELTVLSLQITDVEALGLRRKLMRKCKKTASRFIAHPELRQTIGGEPAKAHHGQNRGRLATEVPEYHENIEYMEKSEPDLEHIKMSVRRNQYLTDLLQLSDAQVDEIANCMKLVEVDAETVVIQKGDEGDKFYVVQDGLLEVLLNPDPEDPLKNLDGLHPVKLRTGDSFGELALLYDSPRKASIAAVRKSSLWVLELSGWRNVLKKMPASRIDEYLGLLDTVPELCTRVQHVSQRRKLADSLEEVYYMSRENVVEEGATGMSLYMVFDGECTATCQNKEVARLSKGDYFGQEMLACPGQHQNTVTVTSEHATILVLDRHTVDAVTCARSGSRAAAEAELAEAGGDASVRRRRSLMHMAINSHFNAKVMRIDANKDKFPRESLQRVGVLGTGSFALVTLEHDAEHDCLFALKAMPKKVIVEQGLKNMVLGEREALVEIESSFVVSLVTTYQDANSIYFLLEPALGGELYNLYNTYESWFGSEAHARFFVVCIALGLQHIHQQRVIHRDIKLENVLLDSQGYARITDLGLAKVVLGKTYTVCGSADYLAPETLKQVGHNRAVDWWALGIVAFCTMSGRMPFDADDVMQIYKNIVKGFRKETFPADFSADLTDFIRSLCRKKPQERICMLPGGVANLSKHPWLRDPGAERWQQISERTAEAPYAPPVQSVEEMRSKLKQSSGDIQFEDYEDDGTGWSKPF